MFTSPQPLAASSGLTIPLQITLSEIKLSAFIIVVFSKQKGLTLVFRNDPLESLKVSSTFDSIQFVRDYLQKTIEGKLRDLMMDELPAIIHRLSLQLWCPDQLPKETDPFKESPEAAVDPLATPPLDAVDANGHLLDPLQIASLSLDGGSEIQSLFSQKNMLRLAALANSHRTLSLFTPGIQNAVFRAWAGPRDRTDTGFNSPLSTPSLAKSHSFLGTATTYTFSDSGNRDSDQLPSRPSLVSLHSATTGLGLGSGRHSKSGRKKKTRVVNLRRKTSASAPVSEATSEAGDETSDTASIEVPASEPLMPTTIPEEPEDDILPSMSASSRVRFRASVDKVQPPARTPLNPDLYRPLGGPAASAEKGEPVSAESRPVLPENMPAYREAAVEKGAPISADTKAPRLGERAPRRGPTSDTSSVILEQAWIMKMAGEIARRVYDEKNRNASFWEEQDDAPPPAYEAR